MISESFRQQNQKVCPVACLWKINPFFSEDPQEWQNCTKLWRGREGKRNGRCYPLNFCHTSLSKLDPEWEPGLESHIPGRGGKWFCCRGYCLGMWAASECRVGLGAFPAQGEKDTLVKEKWFRLQRSERLWVGPTGGGTRTWEYWCHLQPSLDHHFPAQSNFFVTFFLPCAGMSILHVLKPGSN